MVPDNLQVEGERQRMKCPKCNSENVERVEHDYDSPEADELGYYEYECKDCGYIWEVGFEL